ncbi:MAG: hydroxyacid dehydrogenase [Armatimonadetes bacterium]|nr:hydroxyacid dehydrogenase [Armatimonadota bacterium]
MPVILVADKFEKSGLDGLNALGCEVVFRPDAKDDELVEAVRSSSPSILIVRGTKVSEAALSAGPLELVVRAGAGYNTIDVAAASRLGILVANCPGKNAIAVAELAMGLILSLDRRIPDNVADLRQGRWRKKAYSEAKGLYGRTLGLIGLGNIGLETLARAKAFGLKCIAWSRSLTPEKAELLGVGFAESPIDVARNCDIASVHLALNNETRNLLGRDFFAAMKPGAFFINTSRAEVIDQAALTDAVREKGLRAGLDVFDEEPTSGEGEVDAPIFQMEGVYGTHHIGASTEQAQEAIAAETVRIVREYLTTGHAPHAVNLAKRSPAVAMLAVRHFDRVGVLAHVFDCLRDAGINVQETENVVFEGAEAAVARIHLDRKPDERALSSIKECQDIISISLVDLKP